MQIILAALDSERVVLDIATSDPARCRNAKNLRCRNSVFYGRFEARIRGLDWNGPASVLANLDASRLREAAQDRCTASSVRFVACCGR